MAGAHPHQPEVQRRRRRVRVRERGISLIEVLIVLFIIGIIVSVAANTMFSGRTSSGRAAAVASARTMGDAIDDFRKDHGGRPPTLGSARDWPVASDGPIHTFSGGAYLRRGAPEALRNEIAMVVGPSGTVSGTARWALQYAPTTTGAGGWTITVRDSRGVAPPCSIGGGEIGTLPERAC